MFIINNNSNVEGTSFIIVIPKARLIRVGVFNNKSLIIAADIYPT